MSTKSFISLILSIVLVGGAIGGAFLGGQAIGKNSARTAAPTQTRQGPSGQFGNFTGQQGMPPQGLPPGGLPPGDAPGVGFARGGTTGTVDKVEGNVLTLNTQNGTKVSVIIGSNTTIEKMAAGVIGDIQPGNAVTIGGQRNTDGSIQAATILMTPAPVAR